MWASIFIFGPGPKSALNWPKSAPTLPTLLHTTCSIKWARGHHAGQQRPPPLPSSAASLCPPRVDAELPRRSSLHPSTCSRSSLPLSDLSLALCHGRELSSMAVLGASPSHRSKPPQLHPRSPPPLSHLPPSHAHARMGPWPPEQRRRRCSGCMPSACMASTLRATTGVAAATYGRAGTSWCFPAPQSPLVWPPMAGTVSPDVPLLQIVLRTSSSNSMKVKGLSTKSMTHMNSDKGPVCCSFD
jgi:hypothetical protein